MQPAFTMPSSLASTMPNSELSRMASPTISLYRSSKICSGSGVRGKTTTLQREQGQQRRLHGTIITFRRGILFFRRDFQFELSLN